MSKKKIKILTIEDIERACVIFNGRHRKYKINFTSKGKFIFESNNLVVLFRAKADTIDNLLDLFENLIKELR